MGDISINYDGTPESMDRLMRTVIMMTGQVMDSLTSDEGYTEDSPPVTLQLWPEGRVIVGVYVGHRRVYEVRFVDKPEGGIAAVGQWVRRRTLWQRITGLFRGKGAGAS